MKISDFKEKIDDIRLDENKKEEIWEHLNSSSKKKHNYFLRIANVAAIVAGIFIVANVGTYVYVGETLIPKITRKWVGNTTKEFNESDINEINSEREYDDYKYTVSDCIRDEKCQSINIKYKNEDITISPYCIKIASNNNISVEKIEIEYNDDSKKLFTEADSTHSETSGSHGNLTEYIYHSKNTIELEKIKTVKINDEIVFSC